jgi:hypothetical protein
MKGDILMTTIRLLALLLLLSLGNTADEGNGLDPHGGTRVTSSADEGNGIDPHG